MDDDSRSALFEPWVLLPAQLGGGAPWANATSGSVGLMLAVLEDAVRCIERGRRRRHPHTRKLAAEAEAWMRSDNREWPFAFASLCDVLGLDIDATRVRLLPNGDDRSGRRPPHSPIWRIGCGPGRTSVCAPRSRAA